MQSRIVSILATAACLAVSSTASAQITSVSTDITGSDVWCDTETEIVLETAIFVSGNLTILPGCIVRGQPRTQAFNPAAPTAGTPGVLVVSQGGFVDAQGTPTNPIIFTTAAPDETSCNGVVIGDPAIPGSDDVADDANCDPSDGTQAWTAGQAFLDDTPATNPLSPLAGDGTQNVQLWGGLVILGTAPTNLEDDNGLGYGIAPVEGLSVPGFPAAGAQYGGTEPHDCSGIFRHLSVRHAGDVVGQDTELNGVTLGGVGDCTIFENIEIYTNQDDGIEFFGGTANAKNLAIIFAGDDALDLDQGYDGSIQNVLTMSAFFNQNSGADYGNGGSGDAAGEWDGDDAPGNVNVGSSFDDMDFVDRAYPLGAPAIYNMTVLGNDLATNPAFSPNGDNRGIRMRNDFAGILANSIIVNTGGQSCYTVEAPDLADSPDQVNVFATTCFNTAAADAGGVAAAARGDATVAAGEVSGGSPNVASASVIPVTDAEYGFDPDCSGFGSKLVGCAASADPRPNIAAPVGEVGGGIIPTGVGLDSSATYRGAFPSGQPLWTDGWTAADAGGLL